ncbi:MAG: hypothetical protein RMJ97_05820 [Raineya sp.]|nr:hypothetical protein [Raineya sp.]MDW8296389.1 hypothetical protein [Raineya sp.]
MKKSIFVSVIAVLSFCISTQAQKKNVQETMQNPKIATSVSTNKNISANSSQNEDLIIGKWKFDETRFKQIARKEIDKMKAKDPKKASEAENNLDFVAGFFSSAVLEFKRGGIMEAVITGNSANQVEKGTWRLESGGKVLIQKYSGTNEENRFQIVELTGQTLILKGGKGVDPDMQLPYIKQ